MQRLVEKKIVTRINSDRERIVPGRNYRLTEKHSFLPLGLTYPRWTTGIRSHMANQLLDQGQAFRDFVTSNFHDGKDILLSELTNDGSVYCILNLVASQQVYSHRGKCSMRQVSLRPALTNFASPKIAKVYRGRAIGNIHVSYLISNVFRH